jgi:hypothetical protein
MNNNKRYLILFVGVIVLFIIFIGVIFLQQNPKQTQAPSTVSQNQVTASIKQTTQHTGVASSVTLAPPSTSPKIAAQQFYVYYFSSPSNPLANGAYKTNPYLSDQFKTVMSAYYKDGNAPVFCPQNRTANIVVGKEESVYYNNDYLMQEVISQALPGNKDLYSLLLQHVNGKWLIFDINCIT